MALHEVTPNSILRIAETTFELARLRERGDLQRLVRDQIDVVAPDLMVISEEFGQWEDSRRRIDLLALDREANLVVVELKRTDDGGHMELQSLRYAAMISTMTFERAVEAHAAYVAHRGLDADAREQILAFLDWAEPDEDIFGKRVRIILVAADFSRELATTVLWLNDYGLDITCVRFKLYSLDGRLILDVQQLIPLPEAEEYQVRFREKRREERESSTAGRDYTRYDVTVDGVQRPHLPKRQAVYTVLRALCDRGISPEQIRAVSTRGQRIFRDIEGEVEDAATFAERASAQNRSFDSRRWYCADDELIRFGGKTYAVISQWGRDTELFLDAILSAFPDFGITIHPSGAAEEAGSQHIAIR